MKAAQKLEDALKNDQRENAVSHLFSFINALDEILSSLSALPSLEEDALVRDINTPVRDVRGIGVEEPIQVLIGKLKRGEMAAEEQFIAVEQILTETGFDEQLKTIAELIDDIEYEKAAEMASNLLNMVQQKREN